MSTKWRGCHSRHGTPKTTYASLPEAMERIASIEDADLSAYACSRCIGWHVGNSNLTVLELGARASKGLDRENQRKLKQRRYVITERFAHAKSIVRQRQREFQGSH